MRRWIRNVLFAIDVALLAAVLGLWWHSRTAADIAALSLPPDGRTQFAASLRGRVVLAVSRFVVDDRRRWCLDWTSGSVVTGETLFEEIVTGPTVISAVGLIEYHRERALVSGNESGRWWMLVLPHWILIAVLAPWPATRAWVAVRRRRRLRHGCCPECGYDLRITPGRCSECGWTTMLPVRKQRRRWPWAVVAVVVLTAIYGMLRAKAPPPPRAIPPGRIVDVEISAGSLKDALEKFCRQTSLELVLEETVGPDQFHPSLYLHRVDVEIAVKLMEQLARTTMWVDGRRLHVGKPTVKRGRKWCRVYDVSNTTEQMRAFDRELRAAGIVPWGGADAQDSIAYGDANIAYILCRLAAINTRWGNIPALGVGNKVILATDATEHEHMRAAVELMQALAPARQPRALQFDVRGERFDQFALGQMTQVPDPNPLLRQKMSLASPGPMQFKDVLNRLADRTELNVVVHWMGIEAAGISLDMPITVNFKDVPWGQALDGVLAQTMGSGVKLGWLAEKNVVFVGGPEVIDQWWAARVYDVRDIVVARSRWGEISEQGAIRVIELRVSELTVDRGVWDAYDCEREYCAGRLYIWTSVERHTRIEKELAKMRAELKQ